MSLYIASTLPGGTHNPAFSQRGLTSHTSATIDSLDFFGICHRKGLAYDGYRSNIDVFVAATNRGMKISTSTPGCFLSNLSRPLIPIVHPKIVFATAEKMNDDQYSILIHKLAVYEPEKKRAGKQVLIIIHKPTAALYPKLVSIASDRAVHSEGCVNLHAYGAFLHMLRIASEYICVDTYPTNYLPEFDVLRVAQKSILTSYQDMKKVLKERKVQMDLKERAGSSRCVEFDKDARDKLYAILKSCLHADIPAATDTNTKGKKRAAEDEEEEGMRHVKARTAEEILDMDF